MPALNDKTFLQNEVVLSILAQLAASPRVSSPFGVAAGLKRDTFHPLPFSGGGGRIRTRRGHRVRLALALAVLSRPPPHFGISGLGWWVPT